MGISHVFGAMISWRLVPYVNIEIEEYGPGNFQEQFICGCGKITVSLWCDECACLQKLYREEAIKSKGASIADCR